MRPQPQLRAVQVPERPSQSGIAASRPVTRSATAESGKAKAMKLHFKNPLFTHRAICGPLTSCRRGDCSIYDCWRALGSVVAPGKKGDPGGWDKTARAGQAGWVGGG